MAPPDPDGYDAGRRAFLALVASLPAVAPDGALGRALLTRPGQVRDALARWVPRAAFAVAARAQGLADDVECRFDGSEALAELDAAARASVLAVAAELTAVNAVLTEPELLGSFYEGTLGVGVCFAREDTAVVRPRRRAGDATHEVPLGLETLAALRGAERAACLAAHGVELAPDIAKRFARAKRAAELGELLVASRAARARLVPAGRVSALLTVDRRRSGSHYTPRALSTGVVRTTLEPLLGSTPEPHAILSLCICDPALGTGAFLLAACRYLAERLREAEARRGERLSERAARRRVAESCLFGVDRDASAVEVAKLSLWLLVGDPELPLGFLDRALVHGEALLGAPDAAPQPHVAAPPPGALDWPAAFPEVIARGGFDAFVGNPPWVSYAGRAAQPLEPAVRLAYGRYAAFSGYRNLQGLFVERGARLLKPGGRLGFVLPSSMSELAGYAPTRRAHDAWCEPDATLADLGNAAFDGVFQPCMVLASTRRREPLASVPDRPWAVERPDLDAGARALVAKLSRPPLPRELFGERGLQSMGEDRRYLRKDPDAAHRLPLRAGGDVEPFRLRPASFHADPDWFGARLRDTREWRAVRLVVRQTARVPLAALSDGTAFRNSLLAGFEDERYPAAFLVAYLNSSPIRWLHYVRHRDARQGMPQLKIGHLRATPAPPTQTLVGELARIGAALSERARGISPEEQALLDGLVADAFQLSDDERARVEQAKASWNVPGSAIAAE